MNRTPPADVAVVGAGPAGLAAALALAACGVDTMLVAPPFDRARADLDQRTTALLGGSADMLQALGVDAALGQHLAPLRAIRLIDDMGGLVRTGEVMFRAEEAGLTAFGMNVANAALVAALAEAAGRHARITWHGTSGVRHVEASADGVRLTTAEGAEIRAKVVAAADGRNSICRQATGIPAHTWTYPQVAIATVFAHRRPHDGVSTEIHRPHGPMTTVPMPPRDGQHCSSLVWVLDPARAADLAAADDEAFRAALEAGLMGLCGRVTAIGRRASFPLSGLTANRLAANRIALIGEAGHVIPPIGAQGLNLGFRDAATFAELIADAVAQGADPGAERVLDGYDSRRRGDVGARTIAVDLLNRSLIDDIAPLRALRGLGLMAVSMLPALKRAAMSAGMEPVGQRPRLMRRTA
ncbi:MAG: FAD-dependent monooxygenase [Hyphomicrobiales bacterium]|nr:FAD-dependent monooxygenase [Hyphomicrobiales bacterium]